MFSFVLCFQIKLLSVFMVFYFSFLCYIRLEKNKMFIPSIYFTGEKSNLQLGITRHLTLSLLKFFMQSEK